MTLCIQWHLFWGVGLVFLYLTHAPVILFSSYARLPTWNICPLLHHSNSSLRGDTMDLLMGDAEHPRRWKRIRSTWIRKPSWQDETLPRNEKFVWAILVDTCFTLLQSKRVHLKKKKVKNWETWTIEYKMKNSLINSKGRSAGWYSYCSFITWKHL